MADVKVQRAQGVGVPLVAVFIAFLPLAFSTDFLAAVADVTRTEQPPWTLLVVDVILLGVLLGLAGWLRRRLGQTSDRRVLWWWAAGASLTIALDMMIVWVLPDDSDIRADLVVSFLYVVSLAILMAATVGATPARVLTTNGRNADRLAWERFRLVLPLLVGTLAAYVGSLIWAHELTLNVIRTLPEAQGEAGVGADPGLVDALCAGAIDQEYFAQISQIIPLLLVALGLEARVFSQLREDHMQRALTIFTVVLLCVAEAFAISTLPEPNVGCDDVLYAWHEYVAFILTLEGCFVALATLVWALVLDSPKDRASGSGSETPAT